ncbi:MAG: TonB-dependent receptor [Vicinamibacterales bacterium]
MTRLIACCHVALAVSMAGTTPAFAQFSARTAPSLIRQIAATTQGELRGSVLDDRRLPLSGVVVSAVGSTSAFAVTERDGSFVVKNLPAGPYLVRVHLQGYLAPRARVVQVNGGTQQVSAISMTPREGSGRQVLEAGVGGSQERRDGETAEPTIDRSEVAWRLRHLKRSVLKDVDEELFVDDDSEVVAGGWTPAYGARQTTVGGWLTELPFYGRVDLLTSTSFDRPQDLFSLDLAAPVGVTSLALAAPIGAGDWSVQAGLTQGDIASWIVSSSFARRGPTAHHYEAGISYGAQRYMGGNAYMLAAYSDGSRNVGEIYATDRWSANRHLEVNYGAKYARYDYLNHRGLLSPSLSVTITPDLESSLRLNASASRREMAPGAEEFLAPSTGPWMPPQRTFSPLSRRSGFERERVDTIEVSAERQWAGDFMIGVRAFKQEVDGQVVTLFGLANANSPVAGVGHYYVASVGDFDARGWGLSVTRKMLDGVRASVDYTVTDATWGRAGTDALLLSRVAGSTVRSDTERTYDLKAAVESELPQTDTRFFVVYKINSGFASPDRSAPQRNVGARFDVQVNQGLPFLNFATSQWEMLVAVRNMFRDGLSDASVYDELLVLRAPKRIIGGLTVRF